MAGEKYTKGTISDVSWRDMLAQDPYYWLSNSFQYSENVNCDDELHWIKLSQKIQSLNQCANCQLISAGDKIFALPLSWWQAKTITYNGSTWSTSTVSGATFPSSVKPAGVVFQDYVRVTYSATSTGALVKTPVTWEGGFAPYVPFDHTDDTDESIGTESTRTNPMTWWAGVILNYNNSRLVVGVLNELRVYYPELDATNDKSPYYKPGAVAGRTWWKKVQSFEWGSIIIWLTCTFEYLKVWVQDEWWNTKVFYYQGNNDLRNTFVYDLIDLTNTRVLYAYNINGIDYYTASLDWTDWYITLNKIIGKTPVQLFKQKGWLTVYDANQKAWYFVWPTSIDAGYIDWNIYIADSYGVFKFAYNPTGYDTWYMKWKIRNTNQRTPWLCIYKNFVVVSDQQGIKMMRTYDTWVDGYESKGILISREMEWDYGGSVAKVIDEIRCHFELNPLIDDDDNAGDIDIYLSPNNKWRDVDPDRDDTGWWHVFHIDGDSSKQNRNTRFEKVWKLNNLNNWNPAFDFDRETITYCVVIRKGESNAKRTPIVREVSVKYHLKGKTNDVYEITNN